MNWFIKFILKCKKKYDLFEVRRDIDFIEFTKADLLNANETKEREILASANEKVANIRELFKNSTDKQSLEQKLGEALDKVKQQEEKINDMVLWKAHIKKAKTAEQELGVYISRL